MTNLVFIPMVTRYGLPKTEFESGSATFQLAASQPGRIASITKECELSYLHCELESLEPLCIIN
jgi:hypothetical protein